MDPNPVELFVHIVGVIGMFIGFGTLLLDVLFLGRASDIDGARAIARALTLGRQIGLEHVSVIDAIVVASVLLIAATGLHMASYTGDWRSGWVEVAIATFILLAPVGRSSSTPDYMPSRERPKATRQRWRCFAPGSETRGSQSRYEPRSRS